MTQIDKTMNILRLFIGFTILLYSCESPLDRQANHLLPSSNSLELTAEKEIGITSFKIYRVNGDLKAEEIARFPVNVISEKEKAVIKWHKPTNNELRDFRKFVEEEHSENEIAIRLLDRLSKDEYLMALIYDKDKNPLGTKGYTVNEWIELYFLDLSEKKLTHISYGKF